MEHVQLCTLPEWNDCNIEKAALDVAARIKSVGSAFAHCGYTDDGVY